MSIEENVTEYITTHRDWMKNGIRECGHHEMYYSRKREACTSCGLEAGYAGMEEALALAYPEETEKSIERYSIQPVDDGFRVLDAYIDMCLFRVGTLQFARNLLERLNRYEQEAVQAAPRNTPRFDVVQGHNRNFRIWDTFHKICSPNFFKDQGAAQFVADKMNRTFEALRG